MPDDFREDDTLLTGEHVFPWCFDDVGELRPLRDAAGLLAERPWPRLYEPEVLASVAVPAAAAVYAEDPYVHLDYSLETAALVPTLRPWVTNEYEHNGLRVDGEKVLDRLIRMARGQV
jgi:hypothetical protein